MSSSCLAAPTRSPTSFSEPAALFAKTSASSFFPPSTAKCAICPGSILDLFSSIKKARLCRVRDRLAVNDLTRLEQINPGKQRCSLRSRTSHPLLSSPVTTLYATVGSLILATNITSSINAGIPIIASDSVMAFSAPF